MITQYDISKEIFNIRKENRKESVMFIIKKIEDYYEKNTFEEKVLFSRMDELEKNIIYKGSIFSEYLSFAFGVTGTLLVMIKPHDLVNTYLMRFILFPFFLLILILLLRFIKVISVSNHSGYISYITNEEIKIIINKIEKAK